MIMSFKPIQFSPLQGRGRVNADTSVIRPVLDSKKGVIMSQGLYPSYSDIDTYHMAASSIDTAIRNAVAAGADPDYLAILDNFCWCSSNDPERLGSLKKLLKLVMIMQLLTGLHIFPEKIVCLMILRVDNEKGKPISISIPQPY